MAKQQWLASARGTNPLTIMSTDLNALAAGSGKLSTQSLGGAVAGAVENDSAATPDLDLYVDLELVVTFGVAPVAGTVVSAYFVRTVDEASWEDAIDGATPIPPANGFVGNFVVRAVTTAQRMIIPAVLVPIRDFKVEIVNNTAQAFAATLNTLKGYFYKEQVV